MHNNPVNRRCRNCRHGQSEYVVAMRAAGDFTSYGGRRMIDESHRGFVCHEAPVAVEVEYPDSHWCSRFSAEPDPASI